MIAAGLASTNHPTQRSPQTQGCKEQNRPKAKPHSEITCGQWNWMESAYSSTGCQEHAVMQNRCKCFLFETSSWCSLPWAACVPWRYFKNCKTMDSMQGSLEILSRQAFYVYMGKKEQCALAPVARFHLLQFHWGLQKRSNWKLGSQNPASIGAMMVRSKVDGLVAHGLSPQFQEVGWRWGESRLALVTKSWPATCLVGPKLSLHIEYPYILQYPTWILPYLSIEKISSLLGKVKIFLPTNACSSWEWNLLTSQRWKAFFRNQTSPSFWQHLLTIPQSLSWEGCGAGRLSG